MKKVLIVEDDKILASIYEEKLSAIFDVAIVNKAEDGYLKARSWLPDIILLDIILPGKDSGISLLQDLKKNDKTKKVPVIVLSNLENQSQSVMENGGAEYLIKSNITLDEIVERINTYIKEEKSAPDETP